MIKVFHVISHLDLGGAERVAINIAKSSNSIFEYHIVEVVRGRSSFTEPLLKELQKNNVKYHRSFIYSKKMAILLFPFSFFFLFLKHRPKVIHTHTEIPDLSIYLFHWIAKLTFLKTNYIRTIHNTQLWSQWGMIGKKVEPFFIQKDANISISKATQKCYLSEYKITAPIINNGVIIDQHLVFEKLKQGRTNVLFAGRFEYQKGIKELIEVVNLLADDEQYYFHIVGSGSLQNEIAEGLKGDNFSLYEKIYNLSSYLASFDYVFMPSNFEGLALMSIEASMSRTPTIINSCMGLEETLPADWILKVSDNSVSSFINLFKNIIPGINYSVISENAYNYATQNFSIDTMQRKYENLYLSKIK